MFNLNDYFYKRFYSSNEYPKAMIQALMTVRVEGVLLLDVEVMSRRLSGTNFFLTIVSDESLTSDCYFSESYVAI